MKITNALICYLVGILFLSASLVSQASPKIVGFAFSEKTGKSLYQETHSFNGNQHQVVYQNQSGVFAKKTITTNSSSFTPNIEFSSQYCDEYYRVDVNKQLLDIHYRNSCSRKDFKKQLSMQLPFIVDAGFNPYIISLLKRGGLDIQSTFNFPLITRAKSVALVARSISCNKLLNNIKKINFDNKVQLQSYPVKYCLVIKPDNWFLAQLAKPIMIGYDQNRNLTVYTGKANFSDQNGQYQNTVILYQQN